MKRQATLIVNRQDERDHFVMQKENRLMNNCDRNVLIDSDREKRTLKDDFERSADNDYN